MQNPFLIGERIYLRPLERDDATLFVRWANDPDVWQHLGRQSPMNLQQELRFIEDVERGERVVLGIAKRTNDQLIGTVGLHDINHRFRSCIFGIMIGEKADWGQGHGQEATVLISNYAFDVLNLHRVALHVYEENQRARRAYEKAGFVVEGVMRQARLHAGRYSDIILMAKLATDRPKSMSQ